MPDDTGVEESKDREAKIAEPQNAARPEDTGVVESKDGKVEPQNAALPDDSGEEESKDGKAKLVDPQSTIHLPYEDDEEKKTPR